jgi:hypothetical protein
LLQCVLHFRPIPSSLSDCMNHSSRSWIIKFPLRDCLRLRANASRLTPYILFTSLFQNNLNSCIIVFRQSRKLTSSLGNNYKCVWTKKRYCAVNMEVLNLARHKYTKRDAVFWDVMPCESC